MNMNKRKKYLLVIAALFAVAIAIYFFAKDDKNVDITFREEKAKIGDIEIKVMATGTVQPENRLEIKPPISGRVEKVLFEEGQKVRRGQILAWMSSIERAALLDAARAKGAGELKKWEEIYPPTPILAPIKGTIILKNVEPGETFTNNDALLAMSDRLTVKTQVDETDIASIQLKQYAEIMLDAYPQSVIPAQVDKIAFEATTVNNVTTYIVDVLPDTVPDFMRSGMTANVTFVIDSRKNVLLIPTDALRVKDGRTTVLLRRGKDKIEKEVITGISNGKQSEILSGLNPGDIILATQVKLPEKGKGGANPFNPMGNRARGNR